MRLSDVGEFGLLRELERRGLATGIEHDVAVIRLSDGAPVGGPAAAPRGVVVTQDALVEGVHFRLDWTSWRDLGWKSAAVSLSDLAAAGADPIGLVVTLAVPPATGVGDVVQLYEGMRETGVDVIGGDTTAAPNVVVSVTAVGSSPRVPGRAGAGAGDVLVVTGPLGGSAAGYHCLYRGVDGPLARAHRRPPLRLAEGRRLAADATALVDLSDGLARDAGHMAGRSGCRLVIDLESVPVADGVADVAGDLDVSVWELACGFGEDYELLAALAPDAVDRHDFPVVGRCEAGSGVVLAHAGKPLDVSGWEHFRAS